MTVWSTTTRWQALLARRCRRRALHLSVEWATLGSVAHWNPLRSALANVETSVTFDWADLDALVGGLPRSAYTHNAFWKGERGGWPGFSTDVRVGESVTFVRLGSTEPTGRTELAESTTSLGATAGDVILVGCVQKKLAVPAPAKDLYVSTLFNKARAYAANAGVPWFILSAEHGLVSPDEILEPYDLRLSKTSRQYRREWGQRVVGQLADVIGPIHGHTIEIHAGAAYTDATRDALRAAGAALVEPLAGLTLGRRLAWYGNNSVTPAATPVAPALDELVDQLRDRAGTILPEEFLATGAARFKSPGLYSWWVDAEGAVDLSAGLGHSVDEGLIYAGLAGATRSGGRKSKNTLWGRIHSMHLGGRHEFSTFRLSLGSILAEAQGADEIDEASLTGWMHQHLRLVVVPVSDADSLGVVETRVLTALNPPLNLDKVRRDPLRAQLSGLRKKYGRKGRHGTRPSPD